MTDACGCGHDEPRNDDGELEEHEPERLWEVTELRFAALAGLFLITGYIADLNDASQGVVTGLNAVALALGAWTFVPSTLKRLAKGKIGVGTLMTIAAIGAVILGEVAEAAMLAFLYSISEGLEEYAVARTRRGLRALLSLVPAEATILRAGAQVTVSPADLVIGDLLLVRPGERVATDGVIRTGRTALDVSALTGESVPVEAGAGDTVYAGSINGTGVLEVEVTTTAEDNSLARIVTIVEAEQSRKGNAQRLADRIAKPLVPGIMILAAIIAIIGSLLGDPATWIERALVVLVAASPCALAISVPVTVVAAIGAASRIGALVKGGAALEALGRIRTVALDKTGTLTRNQPAVVDVATAAGHTRDHVLDVAAALESRSEHPLARAILAAVPEHRDAEGVEAVTGAGLTGTVAGRPARLGRPGWIPAGGSPCRGRRGGCPAPRRRLRGRHAHRRQRPHRRRPGRPGWHRRRARRAPSRGQVHHHRPPPREPADRDGRGRGQRRPGPGHRRRRDRDGGDGQRRGHRDRRRRSDGRGPAPPTAQPDPRPPRPVDHAAERRPLPRPDRHPDPARCPRRARARRGGAGPRDRRDPGDRQRRPRRPRPTATARTSGHTADAGAHAGGSRREVTAGSSQAPTRAGAGRVAVKLPAGVIVAITAAISILFAVYAWHRAPQAGWVERIAGGAVIGGAVANVVDRARDGVVTDYLHTGWWPTFNLADTFIVTGCIAIALLYARPERASSTPASVKDDSGAPSISEP